MDLEVASVARILENRRVQCVIVMDHCAPSRHQIVGVVSAGQIKHAARNDLGGPSPETVADIMVRPPLLVREKEPAAKLLPMMREAGAAFAPVLCDSGRILGVLFAEDLA